MPILRTQIQPHAVQIGCCEHHPRKDTPERLAVGKHPVQPENIVQVQRVDGHIGVAAHRIGIEADDPRYRAHQRVRKALRAACGEQESCGVDQPQRGEHAPERAHCFARVAGADQVDEDGGEPKRRKQHRLRLDEHGCGKGEQRCDVFFVRRLERAQCDQQREHGIDLPPCGTVDQRRRVEQVERRQCRGNRFAVPPLRDAIQQSGAQQIAEYGHEFDQNEVQRALVGNAQQAAQRRRQPQQKHVSRRIIAEIILGIEIRRTVGKHALRPGAEAVDVRVISAHGARHDDAQHQRSGHRRPEYGLVRGCALAQAA